MTAVPVNEALLGQLLHGRGIDVVLATSKHDVQHLLGG